MPQIFLPESTRSLGHLTPTWAPVISRSVRHNATAERNTAPPARSAGTFSGKNSCVIHSPAPAGLTHRRSIRPRPAVCSPARISVLRFSPLRARRRASRLVESMDSTGSIFQEEISLPSILCLLRSLKFDHDMKHYSTFPVRGTHCLQPKPPSIILKSPPGTLLPPFRSKRKNMPIRRICICR